MKAAADQRQFHRPRIRHVARDVQPVLKKPDDRGGETQWLALTPERNRQHHRKSQLSHRPAVNLQPVAEQPDNRMSRLVEKQVRVVEAEDEAGFAGEQQRQKRRQPANESR